METLQTSEMKNDFTNTSLSDNPSSFSSFSFSGSSSSSNCDDVATPRWSPVERISLAEYERQSKEYTRQQLMSAGLYYKHQWHFMKLRMYDWVEMLLLHSRRMLWPLICIGLVLVLLLGVYLFLSGPVHTTSKGQYMLPPSIPESKKGADVFVQTQNFTIDGGRSSFGVFDYVLSRASEIMHSLPPEMGKSEPRALTSTSEQSPASTSSKQEARKTKQQETSSTAPVASSALVPAPISSPVLAQADQSGMNIFSFAYSIAYEFAMSALNAAFGWTNNDTITSSSSAPVVDAQRSLHSLHLASA